MRVAATEHTARPWRVHALAPDFRVHDVWAFRMPGAGPDDFPAVLDVLREAGGLDRNTPAVRLLFAVRWQLGGLLGWDRPAEGVGSRVPSLVDRLPPDLRRPEAGAAVPNTPFRVVYELADEAVHELANRTVHGACHLGWVPVGDGAYELRMAVLVKANGAFGHLYMTAIAPFRHLLVYPALTRQWEHAWRDRAGVPASTTDGGRR